MGFDGLGACVSRSAGGDHRQARVKCGQWVLMAKNRGGPPSPWCYNGAEGVAQLRNASIATLPCSKQCPTEVMSQGPLDEAPSLDLMAEAKG